MGTNESKRSTNMQNESCMVPGARRVTYSLSRFVKRPISVGMEPSIGRLNTSLEGTKNKPSPLQPTKISAAGHLMERADL
eukprot:5280839-Pyramimonas_sp.AAC.3